MIRIFETDVKDVMGATDVTYEPRSLSISE